MSALSESDSARGGTAPETAGAPGDQLAGEDFKRVFRQHPAGVAVITLAAEHGPVGFTATSVISVSATPPMLAFAIASSSSSWQALRQADTVLVHFLDAASAHLSAQFARRGTDRFAGVAAERLPGGEPLLTDAAAWLRARVVDRVRTGESHLVTLHALEAQIDRAERPLVYHDRTYHGIGAHTRL
ncbi:flavin reductase family protein [Ruania zhangjianzhongii]|uniref:flavin reductase family protein n=1 Tax=Ruania zhangjianzhongii TaxID=2603206 RepID=UPI001F39BB8F|nr:flavin reductase family protein [Ruania zhangjianzhongii]